jgi:hypothetical protein
MVPPAELSGGGPDDPDLSTSLGNLDATALGASGLLALAMVVYSESVLFRTGCGLPAGPFGSLGAAEGVSYLGVAGLVR